MTIRIPCLAAVVLLAACATSGPPRTAGFLKDYSKLRADPNHHANWVWIKPGSDLRVYDRLMIDPIVVMPDPESKAAAYGPDFLQRAATAFRKILVATIDPYYTVVRKPGPNVLRVRIALTDLSPERKDSAGKPGEGAGEAAIEVECVDSVTNEQLAAAVDRIKGSLAGSGKAPREWRHVEGAFIEWANALLDYVDSHRA